MRIEVETGNSGIRSACWWVHDASSHRMIGHIRLWFASRCRSTLEVWGTRDVILSSEFQLVQCFFSTIKSLDTTKIPCIQEQILFNCHIKRAIRGETWREIYLDQPRFKVRIEQDIKAKDLDAIQPVHLVLLHGLDDIVVSTCKRLQNYIIDSTPHQVHIDTDLLKMVAEGCQRPLEANIILLGVFILNKLVVFLVDRVVS